MRLRRPEPHMLAGAYALDALPGRDRAAFERHLAGCADCRQEATGLRAAAARLGEAVAAPPPQRLREQVLTTAARTRQLPPPGGVRAAGDRPAAAARRGMSARAQRPAGIGLVWPPAPRLAVAVAGVCLLVALGLGALTVHTDHRLTQEQARSTGIAAVLNAPDATMMTAYGSHGGRGTAVMSHSEGELVLTTALLPRLPGSERYEVWLMGPRGVRAAGMLPAARKGMTAPVVVRGLAAGDRVGVTAEPAAGTRRPTTPPVLMFVLQS